MKISIGALIAIGTTMIGALTLQAKVADDDAWLRDTRAWVYVAVFPNEDWSKSYRAAHRWVDKP